MLIKNIVSADLPFPLSLFSLAILPPPFPSTLFLHLLPAMAKEYAGAPKLVSESRRSPAATRHLVNFGLKERFW